MKVKFQRMLIAAIASAGVLIAAALVFLGVQLTNRPDEARVIALIEERLTQDQDAQETAAMPTTDTHKAGEISDKEFNARVERGILAFVEKQRRAEEDRPNQLARNVPPPARDDHLYGNPNARFTLIEYSDFECPYCKTVHLTLKKLVDDSGGDVNWVYRHFPLDGHNPGAQREAEASECIAEISGNDNFWKFTNAIYARTRAGGRGFPVENLPPLATEVGTDKAAFEQCLSSGKWTRKIEQHTQAAMRAGVNGTPGNILYDNKTRQTVALHGAMPYERFREAIGKLAKNDTRKQAN